MMKKESPPNSAIRIDTLSLPFETEALRAGLSAFLDTVIDDPVTGESHKIGAMKWGVYAFFDYEGEPIYVGQTNENLRTRIRRHLTNRRTDAVAMSILDPFEVCFVEVWPLPQFQSVNGKSGAGGKQAKIVLDALEYAIFRQAIDQSKFKAILNEKDPPEPRVPVVPPPSFRGRIVGEEVSRLRDHPDLRIARRASVMARLAMIVSERKVQKGLRRALLTQADRLRWLAEQRYLHAADGGDDGDEGA
jgi:hypothetical protein